MRRSIELAVPDEETALYDRIREYITEELFNSLERREQIPGLLLMFCDNLLCVEVLQELATRIVSSQDLACKGCSATPSLGLSRTLIKYRPVLQVMSPQGWSFVLCLDLP